MKKNFIPFVALAGVLLATSCGKDYSNAMFALTYSIADPNMSGLWQPGLEAASVKEGYDKIQLANAGNDDAAAIQLVESAALEDYAAYLINPVDQKNGQTYVDKLKGTKKPVIFWNRKISKEALTSYDKAYYVGIDPDEGGRYQGGMAADYFNAHMTDGKFDLDRNNDGEIGVVVVRGEQGHPDSDARTLYSPMYLERGLKGGNPNAEATVSGTNYTPSTVEGKQFNKVKVLSIVDAKDTGTSWDPTLAQTAVEAQITALGNKIDVILSNNDGMALGILAGARYSANKIPMWGVDALGDAIAELKKEDTGFKGTVKNDGAAQAAICVKAAKNLINGKAVTDGLTIKTDKAEWNGAADAVLYEEAEKQILVHHLKVTPEIAKTM